MAQPERRQELPKNIAFLYSTRLDKGEEGLEKVLFLDRLRQIFASLDRTGQGRYDLACHITSGKFQSDETLGHDIRNGRITPGQIIEALGLTHARSHEAAAYICGPPEMTDEFVQILQSREGMQGNVFCEKWW